MNILFSEIKNPNLEENRAKLMARGLPKQKPIEGVKEIVLVSSGKGGVGKSTISVNLATALKHKYPEKNIGLLDADVFGPSVPIMMNLNDSPLLNEKNHMQPLINYGVKCMSMGFLIEEGSPVIWRGLMVMQALNKLLREVDWGTIDYLIIDTPPGTGDTHLSLMQNIPIAGVILVTTSQTTALQVAKRGGIMYKKLNVPLIGIVENMSTVKCDSCSNVIKLFSNETKTLANDLNCDIIETLPLIPEINESTETGVPLVVHNPDSNISKKYMKIATDIVNFLDKK